MKKLARAIVKMRRLILIAAVLLLIPAAVGAIATPINYDILSYLPQELDSRVGQLLLETDYHLASTNMITVEGMPTNALLAMQAAVAAVPERHQRAGHGRDALVCALRRGRLSAGAVPLAGKLAHAVFVHAGAALPAGL